MFKFQVATVLLALSVAGIAQAKETKAGPGMPEGSKVYVEPMGGFETFLTAALEKKSVPVEVVSDKELAEFVIGGSSESQKPGWAKVIMGNQTTAEEASISVKDTRTGHVVFAYAVDKPKSFHGRQSTAEACAKHLKDWMKNHDE